MILLNIFLANISRPVTNGVPTVHAAMHAAVLWGELHGVVGGLACSAPAAGVGAKEHCHEHQQVQRQNVEEHEGPRVLGRQEEPRRVEGDALHRGELVGSDILLNSGWPCRKRCWLAQLA